MNLDLLTVESAQTAVLEKQTTATALVDAFYEKIDAEDAAIGAYLTLCKERAYQQAARIDALADKGDALPPLAGVPIAVKDVFATKGVRTTAGSKILANFVSPYDATVVTRLEEAGAIILGKTNCDEFAMGSSNENSGFYPGAQSARPLARARRLLGRIGCGGGCGNRGGFDRLRHRRLDSPAGGLLRRGRTEAHLRTSVALRADRLRLVARSRGAVRQERERCGADVAVHGGPRSRSIRPPPTCPYPTISSRLRQPVRGLRIGVPKEYFGEGLDPEVRSAVEAGIQELAKAGCEIVPISLPNTKYAIPTYYVVATAEASSNLARYDGVRYGVRAAEAKTLAEMYRRTRDAGFGAEVKRRIMLGTYVLSAGYYDAYYLKAQRVRTLAGERLRPGIRQGRCHRYAHHADAGVQTRREDRRSSGHVSGRHFHGDGEPGRHSGNFDSVRQEQGRFADRDADPGEALRRAHGVARGARGGTRAGGDADGVVFSLLIALKVVALKGHRFRRF